MFNRKNFVTICAQKEYVVDIKMLIDGHIKTNTKFDEVYVVENMSYTTICTRVNVEKIAKIIEEKLYKSETKIQGNTIFVTFR